MERRGSRRSDRQEPEARKAPLTKADRKALAGLGATSTVRSFEEANTLFSHPVPIYRRAQSPSVS